MINYNHINMYVIPDLKLLPHSCTYLHYGLVYLLIGVINTVSANSTCPSLRKLGVHRQSVQLSDISYIGQFS